MKKITFRYFIIVFPLSIILSGQSFAGKLITDSIKVQDSIQIQFQKNSKEAAVDSLNKANTQSINQIAHKNLFDSILATVEIQSDFDELKASSKQIRNNRKDLGIQYIPLLIEILCDHHIPYILNMSMWCYNNHIMLLFVFVEV